MLKLDRQFGLYVIREPLTASEVKASCRAEDPFFDRDVVLKLVTPTAVGCRENLNRLNPYLESISGLEHPAIAPIYDNGIEDDTCYYTTALYAGGSLADQLTKPMNIGKGLRIILQLSSGLAYAYHEGFEHGKLSLKDIFFTKDGHAVITDFGISATIKNLKSNSGKSSSLTPQDLRVVTLQSLGEILIKLLLGPGAKPDAVSTALLKQSHTEPVFNLAKDLLGESEQEINSLDELLERLTDLAVLGAEVGINEYIEYVEQEQTAPAGNSGTALKPATTPSQRQLEIKEAVYAKVEIRRLVAEKAKLQEILRRAVNYKKNAELKLAAGAVALEAAQKSAASTAPAVQDVTFRITSHRQWHPAIWAVTGLLAGSLLTSGYNHLHQAAPEENLHQLNPPPQTTQTLTAPLPLAPLAALIPAQPEQEVALQTPPVQEETELWWPIGGEFDETEALPASMAPDIFHSEMQASRTAKINFSFPTVAEAAPTREMLANLQVKTAQLEREGTQQAPWWAAGNEFEAPAGQVASGDNSYISQEILSVVQSWARAWSNQDQEQYFSFYSNDYRPEPGKSLEEWRSRRLSRLTRPQWIKVMLGDLQLRSVGENRVQVKLTQSYSSNSYQDQIKKSLNLVKENGQWRILMERSLGPVKDMIGG